MTKTLEGLELAQKAMEAASDKQASDIVLLDLRGVSTFTDYFVICSAESERQMDAVSEEVGHALKKEGTRPHHTEGTPESGWILLDYGDVVIHIFRAYERDFYQLDKLWSQAVPRVRIQ